MKTFREFINEAAPEIKKLPHDWVIKIQPHFRERYDQRGESVALDKLFDAVANAVSKWKVDEKVSDYDENEIGFNFIKSNVKIIMNVNIPKKELRTITLLEKRMVFKIGTKGVKIAEGLDEKYDLMEWVDIEF